MTGWLLDTNVITELRRARPNARVVEFIGGKPLDRLYLSAVSLAELRFGIERVEDVARRGALHDWLTHKLRPMFDGRVLPVTEDIMLKWRLLIDAGHKLGRNYSQPDLLIAATAVQHGLTVVTRDAGDYESASVGVVNPWA